MELFSYILTAENGSSHKDLFNITKPASSRPPLLEVYDKFVRMKTNFCRETNTIQREAGFRQTPISPNT